MGGSRLPDVTFGEWLPDQSRVKSPGLTRCENVVPTARGYRAWPSRSLVIGKDPLVGPCVGAWSGESQSGVKFTVAGTGVGGAYKRATKARDRPGSLRVFRFLGDLVRREQGFGLR